MAEVSGRPRPCSEHDRSLRAGPRFLSRLPSVPGHPVSLGHSSDDRSLHSEHHSTRGSEGFEKRDGGKKNSRDRHSATAPHSGSPLSRLPSRRTSLYEKPPAPAYGRSRPNPTPSPASVDSKRGRVAEHSSGL